jgi:hypothetical protein
MATETSELNHRQRNSFRGVWVNLIFASAIFIGFYQGKNMSLGWDDRPPPPLLKQGGSINRPSDRRRELRFLLPNDQKALKEPPPGEQAYFRCRISPLRNEHPHLVFGPASQHSPFSRVGLDGRFRN